LEAEAPPEWGGTGGWTITKSRDPARSRGGYLRWFVIAPAELSAGSACRADCVVALEKEAPPDEGGAEFEIITTSRGLARSR